MRLPATSSRPDRSGGVIAAAFVVGITTGLVMAGVEWAIRSLLEQIDDLPLAAIAVAPFVGLVLTALILRYLARGTSPALADTWLRAFHDPGEQMETRAAPGAVLASVASIGFGGALGLEGPGIYAGGLIGRWLQRRLTGVLGVLDHNLLMTAGAAAGVAAVFKAPATGVLFALEVPFQDDIARRKLLPCLVAGAGGYLGFVAIDGTGRLFSAVGVGEFDAIHLGGAVIVGLAAGVGARLFVRLIRLAKSVPTRLPIAARVVGAGATTAALLLVARAATGQNLVLGPGYDAIAWAADGRRAVGLLVLVLLLRCLATATSVAGGGAGGLFIPLVVAGALTGQIVAGGLGAPEDSMFLIVGVAAFLGAGYRVPLAAVMFVAETTGRATFVVPALLAAVAADLLMGDRCITAFQRSRGTDAA